MIHIWQSLPLNDRRTTEYETHFVKKSQNTDIVLSYTFPKQGKGAGSMEQDEKNKKSFKRYLPTLILTIVGAAGGYLYYLYVGCSSGACLITSNPVISTIYGGVFGLLIGFIVTPSKKKEKKAHE